MFAIFVACAPAVETYNIHTYTHIHTHTQHIYTHNVNTYSHINIYTNTINVYNHINIYTHTMFIYATTCNVAHPLVRSCALLRSAQNEEAEVRLSKRHRTEHHGLNHSAARWLQRRPTNPQNGSVRDESIACPFPQRQGDSASHAHHTLKFPRDATEAEVRLAIQYAASSRCAP